jgi:hypothetical protein
MNTFAKELVTNLKERMGLVLVKRTWILQKIADRERSNV